jgi:signal peptidase II
MKPAFKIILFFFISFISIGCDRVTKDLAKEHLANAETKSFFNDIIRLQYVENTGAALSLGSELSKSASFWLLSILPLAFLFVLLGYAIKNAEKIHLSQMVFFAMIFSGGVGNIIDRILFDRHVPDFLNLGINNLRTGIFNLADVFVSAGVLGLMLTLLFKKENSPRDTIS